MYGLKTSLVHTDSCFFINVPMMQLDVLGWDAGMIQWNQFMGVCSSVFSSSEPSSVLKPAKRHLRRCIYSGHVQCVLNHGVDWTVRKHHWTVRKHYLPYMV